MEQLIEQYQNTSPEDRCFSDFAFVLMKHIFNRLPDEKKWVRQMSEGQWEDYVAEQLKNTSLSVRLQDGVHNHTSEFWSGEFYDE